MLEADSLLLFLFCVCAHVQNPFLTSCDILILDLLCRVGGSTPPPCIGEPLRTSLFRLHYSPSVPGPPVTPETLIWSTNGVRAAAVAAAAAAAGFYPEMNSAAAAVKAAAASRRKIQREAGRRESKGGGGGDTETESMTNVKSKKVLETKKSNSE